MELDIRVLLVFAIALTYPPYSTTGMRFRKSRSHSHSAILCRH